MSGDVSSHVRIAIVGAGFSGLCMAIRLKQEEITDFAVLERAEELGGTWRDNTYPGCQCDIPSALYSFSFAPNPDWTRFYPRQAEIRDYLRRCARDFGVIPWIRFGHEVLRAEWDEAEHRWLLETSNGSLTADILVGAMGGLSEPAIPDIPGLDRFQGTVFHSATWDHDHDLGGERVAVIGTGASAVQFVPRIQPQVGALHLFQRTPSWVLPDPDRRVSRLERRLFRALPPAQRMLRAALYFGHEATVLGTIVDRRLSKGLELIGRRHLRSQVADPELRAKLTPSYTIGCKRITMSNTYYRSLTRPNAELVTEPIREVRARSIVTADGAERSLDTIILGTGFKVFDSPAFSRVRGRDGRTLDQAWQGSPRAYLGATIAGFPNLFLLVGPNSAGGYNSIVFTTEAHVNYAIQAIRAMDRDNLRAVEVRPDVYGAFNREAERRLRESVWNRGGCASWYLDSNGRNGVWWPGFTWRLWQRTRRFDPADYHLQAAPVQGSVEFATDSV
jgi:cation diffusion facilitator CzcD-associated flavoprotein CzcO